MAQAVITIECGLTSGLGRVRRSLTLAAALEKQGFDITVVLSSDKGMSLVNSLGFSAQLEMPVDLSEALVVIDTCSQTPEEIGEICRASKASLVIDDLAERPIACDYLVNPNLYAKELDYSAYEVGQLFLGPDYALIDQRFFDLAKPKEERSGIVVSFGGTDGGTLALPVVKDLLAGSDEPIYLPVPDYIELDDAIEALSEANKSLMIIRNADMPALLGKCRRYVGSAGATTLEALAAGCEISVAATQSDQHRNVSYLKECNVKSSSNIFPMLDDVGLASIALVLNSKLVA
ncbi:MAG: hypothetical protein AB3N28_04325 [Kordiimonas sp.]